MRRHALLVVCVSTLIACGSSSPTGPVGSGGPQTGVVSAGTFHPVEVTGQGTAQIYVNADGSKELRFTSDFLTNQGPILDVWLISAADANDDQTVLNAQHVDLGVLKDTVGAQTYAIPDSVTISAYHAVTVWCVHFLRNFTTAPLTTQ